MHFNLLQYNNEVTLGTPWAQISSSSLAELKCILNAHHYSCTNNYNPYKNFKFIFLVLLISSSKKMNKWQIYQ